MSSPKAFNFTRSESMDGSQPYTDSIALTNSSASSLTSTANSNFAYLSSPTISPPTHSLNSSLSSSNSPEMPATVAKPLYGSSYLDSTVTASPGHFETSSTGSYSHPISSLSVTSPPPTSSLGRVSSMPLRLESSPLLASTYSSGASTPVLPYPPSTAQRLSLSIPHSPSNYALVSSPPRQDSPSLNSFLASASKSERSPLKSPSKSSSIPPFSLASPSGTSSPIETFPPTSSSAELEQLSSKLRSIFGQQSHFSAEKAAERAREIENSVKAYIDSTKQRITQSLAQIEKIHSTAKEQRAKSMSNLTSAFAAISAASSPPPGATASNIIENLDESERIAREQVANAHKQKFYQQISIEMASIERALNRSNQEEESKLMDRLEKELSGWLKDFKQIMEKENEENVERIHSEYLIKRTSALEEAHREKEAEKQAQLQLLSAKLEQENQTRIDEMKRLAKDNLKAFLEDQKIHLEIEMKNRLNTLKEQVTKDQEESLRTMREHFESLSRKERDVEEARLKEAYAKKEDELRLQFQNTLKLQREQASKQYEDMEQKLKNKLRDSQEEQMEAELAQLKLRYADKEAELLSREMKDWEHEKDLKLRAIELELAAKMKENVIRQMAILKNNFVSSKQRIILDLEREMQARADNELGLAKNDLQSQLESEIMQLRNSLERRNDEERMKLTRELKAEKDRILNSISSHYNNQRRDWELRMKSAYDTEKQLAEDRLKSKLVYQERNNLAMRKAELLARAVEKSTLIPDSQSSLNMANNLHKSLAGTALPSSSNSPDRLMSNRAVTEATIDLIRAGASSGLANPILSSSIPVTSPPQPFANISIELPSAPIQSSPALSSSFGRSNQSYLSTPTSVMPTLEVRSVSPSTGSASLTMSQILQRVQTLKHENAQLDNSVRNSMLSRAGNSRPTTPQPKEKSSFVMSPSQKRYLSDAEKEMDCDTCFRLVSSPSHFKDDEDRILRIEAHRSRNH